MTLPTVQHESDEALKLHHLARMLMHSETFQALCGVDGEADPAARAQAFIWIDADEEIDGAYVYPAAVCFAGQTRSQLVAEPASFHTDTQLNVIIAAKTPSGAAGDPGDYRAKPGDLAFWWSNVLDGIKHDLEAQSGTPTMLSIRSITMQRAARSDFTERDEYGDLVDRLITVETTH